MKYYKELVIKTLYNLEPILEKEIIENGGTVIKKGKRLVVCEGNQAFLYKAILNLRTALRILVPIASFKAYDTDELYQKAYKIDWSKYLTPRQTFAIDSVVNSPIFTHSQYAGLKLKDALVDKIRDEVGTRPSVNTRITDIKIHLHISNKNVNIYLDASGFSLNQRKYRAYSGPAPLNEVLAAGIVLKSGYKGQLPFYDPMCGSATLGIEAAMIATKTPPHIRQDRFCLQYWNDYDAKIWNEVKNELEKNICSPSHIIRSSDKDFRAYKASNANVMSAYLDEIIEISKGDFDKFENEEGKSIVILNPPYDERLTLIDIDRFYRQLSKTLQSNWQGSTVWVISPHDVESKTGIACLSKTALKNGEIDCNLFELKI